jgi:hypothetical protein
MPSITPNNFWRLYKADICEHGSWEAYQSNPRWTQIATEAAIAACTQLKLLTSKEYFRLDLLGYDEKPDAHHDWSARIAFEVENSAHWKDELCKLSHIIADLCVLATYESHATWTAKEALEEYLQTLGDRVCRVHERQWLFIFGPSWKTESDPWNAYTLDANRNLVSVDEGPPLHGVDLKGRP